MKLSKQSFYFARDGDNLLNIALTNLSFVLEGSCLSAFFDLYCTCRLVGI